MSASPIDYMNRPQIEAYVRRVEVGAQRRFLAGMAFGIVVGGLLSVLFFTVLVFVPGAP